MSDRLATRAALLFDAYIHPFRLFSIVSPTGDPPLHVPQVYVYLAYLVSVSPIVPPCSIVFFVHASIFLVHPLIS